MTTDSTLLFSGIVLTATSGLPGLLWSGRSQVGQWISATLAVFGAGAGLVGAFWALPGPLVSVLQVPGPMPLVDFDLAADTLSAFFLVPVFLISLLGSIYGLDYWRASEHPDNCRKLRIFYGLMTAALAVLILARNSVTFLFGWEIMAISAFFLIATDDQDPEVLEAGWLFLAISHAATLCLFAMFALMYGVTGSFDLAPLTAGSLTPTLSTSIFLLALVGFGMKAGVMPLHFWLPSAHAMAPSHVSALMSGVLIKTGIYGLVRITSLLPEPPLWWGGLVLGLGVASAVLGVAFALGQHDLKRLLAYHSIENIGIIVIGLGLALLGRTMGQGAWIVLGLGGCLLHVWNHSLFKSLLFLCAGSVIHARGTREMDRLGGLAKMMPWTAGCFLIGATAICGLPPLNGFVSELLIYNGLFRTLGLGNEVGLPSASFAVPALALMGALAVACFVKVYGVVFLGVSREPYPQAAHESPWTMCLPLCVLSACCIAIGLGPTLVAPLLDRTTAAWIGGGPAVAITLSQAASLWQVSQAAIFLLTAMVLGALVLQWRLGKQPIARTETWGCGYTGATPRMQYTASSFAQMLVALFGWALRPSVHKPRLTSLFPQSAKFESHVPEVVLDGLVLPAFHWLARILLWFRLVQQGSVQIYLIYIFAILILLLLIYR